MPDVAEYCRQIESYLCQKNEGHLIRIVGPAFEQVCGWAEQGVPLKIAFRGIDRCCERHRAKANRRRPVRIEFCEADILELFDDWRRATGVTAAGADADRRPRKPALAAHIERVVARLAAARGGRRLPAGLDDHVEAVARELDRLAADARHARGAERIAIIGRLSELDQQLTQRAIDSLGASTSAELLREAESELAPFGSRIAPEARLKGVSAAFGRLARESMALPVISYE